MQHEVFERHGVDLLCEVPVSFTQAALGAEVEVPTLEGPVKMKVPAGTQSGRVFRLRGKGIADIHGRGRGDQHVRVVVEVPAHLSPEQRRLLEEFAKLSGDNTNPQVRSFMEKVKKMFS
jgi:molecular chaperone DnaJ